MVRFPGLDLHPLRAGLGAVPVTDDLPRIGTEPDCEYPGCQLLGRTRTDRTFENGWRPGMPVKIVCSLHATWNGEAPDAD